MSTPVARPLSVAIVGAGPSGFYAAEALLASGREVRCDVFDRLPTPYGLVRGGVAPDHQNIKKVVALYEKIARKPGFRFFGNVRLGRDLQTTDLFAAYDAVVYAVGNEDDRPLGIPGEELAGSHSATEFVFWYNGHPDYKHLRFDLNVENAVVVGIGNVAMDVARVLAQDPEDLAKTDMPRYAVDALRAATKLKRIYVLGRRGPAQAAFTPKEIKELGELEHADLLFEPNEAALDPLSAAWLEQSKDPNALKNMEYVREHAHDAAEGKPRQIHLRFLVSPTEFLGDPGGRLAQVRIERNVLQEDGKGGLRPRGTGTFELLDAGLAFRAVGYRGIPIPGVPFDARSGTVPNREGRVLVEAGKQEAVPGAYVVGWAKRGPSGLIGTNKLDSAATVSALLDDFPAGAAGLRAATQKQPEAIVTLLRERGVRYVTFEDWLRLDAEELRRGAAVGKLREKFTDIAEMVAFLDGRG
ncbi:MAG: FAD-dependent oxidoreductase [Planctomycetes bacterium]|nr:FAD-dependent oxidoreductase [Planctomycetota bacterium]